MWRAAVLAMLLSSPALAAPGAPSNCSGTVGTQAAAVSFPASGNHGPAAPITYLAIVNPAAPGTTPVLYVNPFGATAVANAAGTIPIYPGGSVLWNYPLTPPPGNLSIIASASSTAYTCAYQ